MPDVPQSLDAMEVTECINTVILMREGILTICIYIYTHLILVPVEQNLNNKRSTKTKSFLAGIGR